MMTILRSRRALRCASLAASLALLGACGDDGSGTATEGEGSETGTTGDATTTTTAPTGATTTTTGETTGDTSTGGDTETTGDTSTTGGDVLLPDPGEPRYALVGEEVVLDGSNSVGAVKYQWFFDDGEGGGWDAPMDTPIAKVTYAAIGRRKPILTVFDGEGNKLSASVTISVVEEPVWEARHASSVIAFGDGEEARFAAVSPDSDEVMIAAYEPGEQEGFVVARRASVSDTPRTLAHHDGWLIVAAQGDDRIDALPVAAEGPIHSLELPYGARPYGVIVTASGAIYATLQGTGEVALLALDPEQGLTLAGTMPAIKDARGLALLPDGRLAVSRWRSPAAGGEISIVDPEQGDAPAIWPVQFDPQPPSDTEIGGVPSYLSALVVAPNGAEAALPSIQGNVKGGSYISGEALHFDTTLRAVVSYFDLGGEAELFGDRKQFDGRGLASAAAYSYYGDYLFVATRGSQSVERIDRFTGAESSSLIEVGYAPQGLAVSRDGRFLAVDAYLARELVIYDLSEFGANTQASARLELPSEEPLPAELLRGKQLFNDSLDPRLSKDGYIACAHCHLDGESDLQVWDFTDRGEGLRDTISLAGHAGTGDGPLHWSANFDEVQDF
ncbi:MAG: hypothetical protein KC486_12605, partial [Myxococcales bacterium]|nr:hypothetical protein [Myxococcales bacterium]